MTTKKLMKTVTQLFRIADKQNKRNEKNQSQKISQQYVETIKLNCTILESVFFQQLFLIFNNTNKLFPLLMYAFFQVLLSCKIMDLAGVNHNHLHMSNI